MGHSSERRVGTTNNSSTCSTTTAWMSSKVHGLDFGSQAIASSIGETLLNNNRNGGWRLQQHVLDGRQQMSPFQRYEPKHDSIPFSYRPAYIEVTKTILRQLKSSFYNAWCMVDHPKKRKVILTSNLQISTKGSTY
jgi:hypothetical protein